MPKHVRTTTGVPVILYPIPHSHVTVVNAAVKILDSHALATPVRLLLKVEVMTSFVVVSYMPWTLLLVLKCQATGQRKCKNAKIFCPMAGNCICEGCPSNAKMYCPTGVTCSGGSATIINMDKYICKGTGSNMYCPDIDESIETCGTHKTSVLA